MPPPVPELGSAVVVSTDPPYYDNIGYADLSDFFYVWLRRPSPSVYPDLFGTLLTPKSAELVATPYRFGGKEGESRRALRDRARRFLPTHPGGRRPELSGDGLLRLQAGRGR